MPRLRISGKSQGEMEITVMRTPKIIFEEAKALELYHAGYNDTQIADELGVKWQDITRWRNRNKLPSNLKRRRPNERYKRYLP